MLKQIKQHFDVSSLSIALFIKGSLNTLNSYSINRRGLSFQQKDNLLTLFNALELEKNNSAVINETVEVLNKNVHTTLSPLITALSRRIKKKEQQLQNYKTSVTYYLKGLHACENLIHKTTFTEEQQKWIILRKKHLQQKLQERATAILQMHAELEGLKARKNSLEKAQLKELLF